jgi:hemerythrin
MKGHIRQDGEYQNLVLLDQMIVFMRKWFLTHIFNDDSKYVPHVQHYFSEKEKKKNKIDK